MVRAKVVTHPSEWPFTGYNEIQNPRKRYAIIDYEELMKLLNFKKMANLADAYRGWIEEALGAGGRFRDGKRSESIAVGSESFVLITKEKLGIRAKGRKLVGEDGSYVLRESLAPYNSILGHENDVLRPENIFLWKNNP